MKSASISLLLLLTCISASAQYLVPPDTGRRPLPFAIDPSKRMPEDELADKKTGTFVTGLPRFEYDPIRGFGAGGNAFLFFNKDERDPFFEYTPYRHRLNAELFIYQNGRISYALNYDAPYLLNSPWRMRADVVFYEDPNAQYWGIGRDFLRGLQFTDARTGQTRRFRRLRDYEENLTLAQTDSLGIYRTNHHFNQMVQQEQLYNVLGERVFLGGRLRLMFGIEFLFTKFTSYQGRQAEEARDLTGRAVDAFNQTTLFDIQREDGTWNRFNLSGYDPDRSRSFYTGMLAAALIYDTRDYEPDPSRGIFLQYSHEHCTPWLGSDFNFHKFMIQGQYIATPLRWREGRSRLTFAGMACVGYIFGLSINFIEMWDLSSQAEAGGILVLGGARSIRGFREARFVAPAAALVNLELRSRFYDFRLLRQHFHVGLVPFFDTGSVWDRLADFDFSRWVAAPGLGARMGWNQSTIFRLDYGRSTEGGQVFFSFGHIF